MNYKHEISCKSNVLKSVGGWLTTIVPSPWHLTTANSKEQIEDFVTRLFSFSFIWISFCNLIYRLYYCNTNSTLTLTVS